MHTLAHSLVAAATRALHTYVLLADMRAISGSTLSLLSFSMILGLLIFSAFIVRYSHLALPTFFFFFFFFFF
ncbi:hypothetical protein, partial [Burkholderia sp. Ac-20392]|uniref:hypothetical protein n=1 Tax=Burkholderia sp. Ac-20392 TaxID=2703905 RepID=UPI00198126F7